MAIRDIIPWSRSQELASPRGSFDPFLTLHREMNRLFDDVFRSFDTRPSFGRTFPIGSSWPNVEISDNDKQIKVTAEVPGLEEKDIEIFLADGVLTLKGEKKTQLEDRERQFSERYYGHFERRIPLGFEVEEDKVEARFKNGLLTITLPKSAKAQSQVKRIEVKS